MANVQTQFDDFNGTIMLKRFVENKILRDKRSIIQDKLKENLASVFEKYAEGCPKFDFRDQGSYEMGTGVKPLDGDYDIDQGLYFSVSTLSYPDPVGLKKRVHEALDGHTDEVRIRQSCVTVFYHQDDEPIYHVDIAIYSDGLENPDGRSYLAKGKEFSSPEFRYWEVSDPEALTKAIEARFDGNALDQYRKVVRYLKRWKDVNFPSDGNAAPLGIGLTIAAYNDFQPYFLDILTGRSDDLLALQRVVTRILNQFVSLWDENEREIVRRLKTTLPIEPYNDLFERMTTKQMGEFENKLKMLQTALDDAAREVDPVDACIVLQKVLGEDFPVPAREETAKHHAPAIVSSSNSA